MEIAGIAALVADASRAQTLMALMDGRALPAGELALISNVSPATMSAHLSKLVRGGLLKVESQGKHRYYRLAGPKVASLLETFGTLAPLPRSALQPRNSPAGALRFARTCYRHLAGHLAVELNSAAQKHGFWIPSRYKEYRVTRKGEQWLAELGIRIEDGSRQTDLARACLDWSERRHHISGPLGTLLLDRLLELKWFARVPGSRAVRLTHSGQLELSRVLGLQV